MIPQILAFLMLAPVLPGSGLEDLSDVEQKRLQVSMEVAVEMWLAGQDPEARYMREHYYAPDPEEITGWATRFGTDDWATEELWFAANEALAQYTLAGYSLAGGGYGYQVIDGDEYLMTNRSSEGFELLATGGIEWDGPITLEQRRLFRLASMDFDTFTEHVAREYAGVVFTRSPNDIGRTFCLKRFDGQQIGDVIVGNVSALHDYTPLAGRPDPLGLQVARDEDGRSWRWIVDLPDSLYYASGGEGGPAFVKLTSGDCDRSLSPPPSRFACPVASCTMENVTQSMTAEHPAVDFRTGISGPVYALDDAWVRFAGKLHDGCGIAVILAIGGNWRATYCHLGRLAVKIGQPVERGQFLGSAGDTGDALGHHAHVELTDGKRARNPLPFVIDPVVTVEPVEGAAAEARRHSQLDYDEWHPPLDEYLGPTQEAPGATIAPVYMALDELL